MALELAFKRLRIGPSPICHQCRRTLVSSVTRHKPQSPTEGLAESLQRPSKPPNPSSPRTAIAGGPQRATSEPSGRTNVPRTSYDLAANTLSEIGEAAMKRDTEQKKRDLERGANKMDLEKQAIRKWRVGDVYAPHDLTGVEQAKWKKLRRRGKGVGGRNRVDVVDQLGINPVEHYKNFAMMSEYMSEMGRIKHSNETGLRPVNQRKMAKAIRRAIGTGLMPGVHRHPEILRIEMNARMPR